MSILEQIVMWSLAIIFAGSAGLNLAGPEFVREEFEKWNYPSWLRFAVAGMEFAAAALLVRRVRVPMALSWRSLSWPPWFFQWPRRRNGCACNSHCSWEPCASACSRERADLG